MSNERRTVYKGDSLNLTMKEFKQPKSGVEVPYGEDVEGVYYDSYPQVIKEEMSQPIYEMKVIKDVTVTLRDGAEIKLDIYRPDTDEDI